MQADGIGFNMKAGRTGYIRPAFKAFQLEISVVNLPLQ
jgi:hypothetical protein